DIRKFYSKGVAETVFSLLREKNREFLPGENISCTSPHQHRRSAIAEGINREIIGNLFRRHAPSALISLSPDSEQLLPMDYTYRATTNVRKSQGIFAVVSLEGRPLGLMRCVHSLVTMHRVPWAQNDKFAGR